MNQKLSYAENAPIKLITSLAGIVVAMFLFQWLAVAPAHATIGLSSSVVTKWNLDVTVDLGGPFNVVADATIDTDVTTFTAMVNTKTIGGGPEEYSIPFSGTHNNGVYTVANFPFDAVPGEQGTIDLATFTIDGDQLNGEGTFTVIIPDVGEVQGNLIITGTQTGKKPTLETIEVIDLKADSALIIARISSNGGTAIIEKGAVYATAPEPAIGSGTKIVSETTGEEVFFTGLTGLIPNTLYYVRAFATNDEGTAYGEQLRFTTPVRVKYANAGFLSQNIACNNKTHKVFVANNIGNSVTIIDGISGKPDTTLAVGQGAYHVGVHKGSNKVYVPNNFDNTVSVIDVKNLRVETTVAVGVGPRAALVNELTHKVYIPADFPANPGNVYVLDGKTNAIEQVIPVGRRPLGGAINQKTNKIYIANSWSNNVTIIDGATGNAQNVAAGNTPRHIAVNDSTNRIYVVNYRDSSITVIDGKTNQTEIIHLGWNTFPWAAAVNRLTNRIYVSNSGTNTVTVIDGVTNATHTINVGESPHSLVVNEASNRIYIGNFNDDERSEEGYLVTCIDGETDEIVGYACVSNPSELAVDIKLNKTFVMTFNDKVMTVEENRPVIQVDPETLQIASVAGSNVSFDITSDMAWSVYTQSAW
nr:beta-propeller fold lactonase family protein [Prolixibacteraceae bacterium]